MNTFYQPRWIDCSYVFGSLYLNKASKLGFKAGNIPAVPDIFLMSSAMLWSRILSPSKVHRFSFTSYSHPSRQIYIFPGGRRYRESLSIDQGRYVMTDIFKDKNGISSEQVLVFHCVFHFTPIPRQS